MREFVRVNKTYKQLTIQTMVDDLHMIHLHSPDEWCWVLSKGYPGEAGTHTVGIGVDMNFQEYPDLKGCSPAPTGWIMGECHKDGSVSIQLMFEKVKNTKE